MNYLKKCTSGIILVVIGLFHTNLTYSSEGFGKQMSDFAQKCYFNVSPGMDEFPAVTGHMDFEHFAAFWFFYFGILMIPIGLLIHGFLRESGWLPLSFTVSYLLFVLLGVYMIPNSGMTFFLLPHALYMLIKNSLLDQRKVRM
ncbi:MAG: DUF6463 family protein [Fibrobacterales bacterium]